MITLPGTFNGARRGQFIGLCAIALTQALLGAAVLFTMHDLVDNIMAAADPGGRVVGELALLTVIGLLIAVLRQRERVVAERIGQGYVHAVRLRLFDRLSSLTQRDLQQRSRGGHLLRFIGDLTALRQWVSLGLARLGVALTAATVSLSALAMINRRLALAVAGVLCIGALAALALGPRLRQVSREARHRRARLAGDISERIATMPVVQLFSQIRRERGRIGRRSSRLGEAMIARAGAIGQLRGLVDATVALALVTILAVGQQEIASGRAGPGALFAALALVGLLTPALRDLGRVYEYWHGYRVALERIDAFLSRQPSVRMRPTAPPLPAGGGEIHFDGVSFGPLTHIDATAPAGSTIAIVGANGCGKSTLLSLIARQVEPAGGTLRIDGGDLRRCNGGSIREAIGVVGPDLPLLRGTLGRNLRYRQPRASRQALDEVVRQCGLEGLLQELPGGMEARIAEGGTNLSPGQRQRIALARALLGQPRILLLDEVDANLDPASGLLVERVLRDYPGTVLLVSHRPEQIACADRIWHLADGVIAEQGSPGELLQHDSLTRRLLRRPLAQVA